MIRLHGHFLDIPASGWCGLITRRNGRVSSSNFSLPLSLSVPLAVHISLPLFPNPLVDTSHPFTHFLTFEHLNTKATPSLPLLTMCCSFSISPSFSPSHRSLPKRQIGLPGMVDGSHPLGFTNGPDCMCLCGWKGRGLVHAKQGHGLRS